MPTHDSYVQPENQRNKPGSFDRGHMAPKFLVERLGLEAGKFSHNIANAVPQRHAFNANIWYEMECRTDAWANAYGKIWVIAGPIFDSGARRWLKSNVPSAVKVAIPDRLFKIIIREPTSGSFEALAFIYPQSDASFSDGPPWDQTQWLASVSQIEKLTGQEFLKDKIIGPARTRKAASIWPVKGTDLLGDCANRYSKYFQ